MIKIVGLSTGTFTISQGTWNLVMDVNEYDRNWIACHLKVLVGGERRNSTHRRNVIARRESQMTPNLRRLPSAANITAFETQSDGWQLRQVSSEKRIVAFQRRRDREILIDDLALTDSATVFASLDPSLVGFKTYIPLRTSS